MEHVFQLIQSYFNFRAAVLRSADLESMSNAEFSRLTGLSSNTKYIRLNHPDLWQPAEIYVLAKKTGLWEGGVRKLDLLAELITQLPLPQQRIVLRAGSLTGQRLAVRRQDPNSWQAQELAKLQAWYRTNTIRSSELLKT
ncbi:hypothetical protein [Fibrella forsythiae]|uniref:Uncharacterized protein n=1 Tax=Fibrella forsythiae TaxID=2817061 RepID=A0ABS3JT04_9BACT|nr:hypothetical protein [Fibrella forsythiae]MBO0953145.1 hypothetical protein [Fibrella forsythiae]